MDLGISVIQGVYICAYWLGEYRPSSKGRYFPLAFPALFCLSAPPHQVQLVTLMVMGRLFKKAADWLPVLLSSPKTSSWVLRRTALLFI